MSLPTGPAPDPSPVRGIGVALDQDKLRQLRRASEREHSDAVPCQMDVRPPPDVDPERFETLKAEEKAMSQELQRVGKWRHLWRIAGRYANISVLDVERP